jgi:hypothetical protein
MPERVTNEDLALLQELGVDTTAPRTLRYTVEQQRVIAGFEEIERFVKEQGRIPQHGEDRDIFERLYAVRLDRIRASTEYRELLRENDSLSLLNVQNHEANFPTGSQNDEELLAALGVESALGNDLTRLVHVRSREEIKAAEEVAQRNISKDFDQFKPIFDAVQSDLKLGLRQTVKYKDDAEIVKGDMFILEGIKVLVADYLSDAFVSDYGRTDRRLRVIYDNGTESDLLLRSLQRALNRDPISRRIKHSDSGPLFSNDAEEGDLQTGYIYVLRSKSENPFVAENRSVLHKIGVTGGDVKSRVANARKDPTYLLADVEIIATFKLSNVNRKALEALLHKFFGRARLDLELKDRFGGQVEPREWFLVPLQAIEEAIQKIKDGTIGEFRYDPETASLIPA